MAGVSRHYDAMQAIKTRIEGFGFTGLTGGVVIQEMARHVKGETTLPFISLSPFGQETVEDANSSEDANGYPVLVAIVATPDLSQLETRLGWREQIMRKFNNMSLAGQTLNYNVKPEPQAIVSPQAWQSTLFGSSLVLRCFYQGVRT